MTGIVDRNTALLDWFEVNARDLPWRRTTDPYPVLVSEVMLQQTQVDRVIPKFNMFMDFWPDVASLSTASTNDLLSAWSGLGYNSRALRLRSAAGEVSENGWPDSIRGLERLAGVGPYTAAAIGSISFGFDAPALDTNLRRVLSRWAGEPLTTPQLQEFAFESLGLPAGDWNQALMDLGSSVCTPRNPMCDVCPVAEWCIDPSVYEPPPRQSAFNGSNRQLRGALVRAHLGGEDPYQAGQALSRSRTEIEDALDGLVTDGLISPSWGHPDAVHS